MIIQEAIATHRGPILELLAENKLPSEDIGVTLEHFWVALENEQVVGAIGLEIYGQYGLLRSMVVSTASRGQGIASMLVGYLEDEAGKMGIDEIYLLTETAPDYFLRHGYMETRREEVPEPLKVSTEFSHVCPASARIFSKTINHS
ncbi:MAG: arsenic resistance N-acetyltransferase ArsN2 [Sphingobacteriales bacterium]|jgi:amino-acid N-acetyltransferase